MAEPAPNRRTPVLEPVEEVGADVAVVEVAAAVAGVVKAEARTGTGSNRWRLSPMTVQLSWMRRR